MTRLRHAFTLVLLAAFMPACYAPDPQNCPVATSGLTPQQAAIKCAEAFIERNGYTTKPPSIDTTLISFETVEFVSSREELLASRHGRLEPRARWYCPTQFIRHRALGHTVGFRRTLAGIPDSAKPFLESTLDSVFRAVTMDTALRQLLVEHMPLFPRDQRADSAACKELPR